MRVRASRTCVVCGDVFHAPPSARRKACKNTECRAKVTSMKTKRHGETRTRLYNIWSGMKARCKGTAGELARKYYKHVTFCEEWKSFESFRDWALANGYESHLEIDRKDNTKGYGPENCRWATRAQQMQNTRTRNHRKKTSKYKGVQYVAHCKKKWRAVATFNSRPVQIGLFETEEEAARAYDQWVIKTHGEFCNPNFSQGGVQF